MIHSHGTDPLQYLDFQGDPTEGEYLGVELELEGTQRLRSMGPHNRIEIERGEFRSRIPDARTKAADRVVQEAAGFLMTKYDGSLRWGVEFVSAPAVLTVHQARWPKILQSFRRRKLFVPKESCGLHVHINRRGLPDEVTEVLCRFPGEERGLTVRVAGREEGHPFRINKKRRGCVERFENRHHHNTLDWYQPDVALDHYEAINLSTRRRETIEVRVFASTIDTRVFLGRLEFVAALVKFGKWVKDEKAKLGEGGFVEWFCKHRAWQIAFPNLTKLLVALKVIEYHGARRRYVSM